MYNRVDYVAKMLAERRAALVIAAFAVSIAVILSGVGSVSNAELEFDINVTITPGVDNINVSVTLPGCGVGYYYYYYACPTETVYVLVLVEKLVGTFVEPHIGGKSAALVYDAEPYTVNFTFTGLASGYYKVKVYVWNAMSLRELALAGSEWYSHTDPREYIVWVGGG